MKMKEENGKVGLKLNIQETRIMASGPITSWEIDGETVETVTDFFWGPKITADGDCSHEIKRCLLLGRKVMTNLDSILKSRDITLPIKVCLVKAMVFPVVMYRCESWTVRKAEYWRIDAFELWCWRRLLRVPWTARRANQSILKEISPGCSLEGLMLKLNSNTLATSCEELTHWKRPWCWEGLGAGGEGDEEDEMVGWHHRFDGYEFEQAPGVGDGQGGLASCGSWRCKELHTTQWWIELKWKRNWLIGTDPDAGKDWRQEKVMTEDEVVGWHHRLDSHEFEQAPRVGDGQRSLAFCRPWGYKELELTEWLNCIDEGWKFSLQAPK